MMPSSIADSMPYSIRHPKAKRKVPFSFFKNHKISEVIFGNLVCTNYCCFFHILIMMQNEIMICTNNEREKSIAKNAPFFRLDIQKSKKEF